MSYANTYSTTVAVDQTLTPFQQEKVSHYLVLVKKVVSRIIYNLPQHLREDDLVHNGILGLIDAVKRFEWGRDNEAGEFKAYAECRIRGEVIDELRRLDVLPRSTRDRVNQVKKKTAELSQKLKREPTAEEVCNALEIDLKTYQEIRADADYGKQEPLETQYEDGELREMLLHRTIDQNESESPENAYAYEEIKQTLAEEIMSLKERDQQVISLRYLEELPLKDIATVLSVTESRVSQIHAEALKVLKGRLKKRIGFDLSLEKLL